ncbi:hypothetical protein K0M31_020341, partial [Melipona bicolor]
PSVAGRTIEPRVKQSNVNIPRRSQRDRRITANNVFLTHTSAPTTPRKEKKQEPIDEETKPARYLLRKPTLHVTVNCLKCLLSSNYRSPCRHHLQPLERTNEAYRTLGFRREGRRMAGRMADNQRRDRTKKKKKNNVVKRGEEER